MTNKEIKRELKKIYKERRSWNVVKLPFTNEAINHRLLTLRQQYTLYKIQDARKGNDNKKEVFNFKIYKIIDNYLKYDF